MSDSSETLVKIDLKFKPAPNMPDPTLIQSEHLTFLMFNAVVLQEKTYHEVGAVLLELVGCKLTSYGKPDNNTLAKHPVLQNAVGNYEIYEIKNSSWLEELKSKEIIVDTDKMRHFVLTFIHSTFHCVCCDMHLEITDNPYQTVLLRMHELWEE